MGRRLSPWPAQTEMVAPEIQELEISENLSFPGNLRADHEPKTISTLTRPVQLQLHRVLNREHVGFGKRRSAGR